MLNLKPWDIEPDLTLERLVWLARLFVSVRRDARTTHDPLKGDGAWGFGCKCYERQIHAIGAAARSGEQDWLRVVNDSMKFVFSVGRVPARFYKGEVEFPRQSLRRTFDELRQRPLALGQSILPGTDTLAWCFAIETDGNGLASRISIAAFSVGEDLVHAYEIPFDEADSAPIIPIAPPPVPLGPPAVSGPPVRKKVSDESDED